MTTAFSTDEALYLARFMLDIQPLCREIVGLRFDKQRVEIERTVAQILYSQMLPGSIGFDIGDLRRASDIMRNTDAKFRALCEALMHLVEGLLSAEHTRLLETRLHEFESEKRKANTKAKTANGKTSGKKRGKRGKKK